MARRIWVERLEDGSWIAKSEDGATLKFGKGEGQFSPVELMQIALAGCTALSSQYAVEHTIGEGKGARIVVNGTYDPEEGTYLRFQEDLTVDATSAKPALTSEDAQALKERMEKHISKGCTVKHTLERGAQVRVTVNIRH